MSIQGLESLISLFLQMIQGSSEPRAELSCLRRNRKRAYVGCVATTASAEESALTALALLLLREEEGLEQESEGGHEIDLKGAEGSSFPPKGTSHSVFRPPLCLSFLQLSLSQLPSDHFKCPVLATPPNLHLYPSSPFSPVFLHNRWTRDSLNSGFRTGSNLMNKITNTQSRKDRRKETE